MSGSTALLLNLITGFSHRLDECLEAQKALAPLGQTAEKIDAMMARVDEVFSLAQDNHRRAIEMSQAMDDLAKEVANVKSQAGSAVVLIRGLRDQIAEAGTDPAKLAEITASLKATEDDLAAAVATPGPAPDPAPEPPANT